MKIRQLLLKIETVISGTAFTILVAVTAANVISRFLFMKSFSWTEEISHLCFNWAVFFGACILYANQGLIAIDAVVDRLPPKAKRVARALAFALIFLMCVGLVIWGVKFSLSAWVRPTAFLHIPYFFFDISVPLSAAIMAGYSVDFFIRVIRGEEIEETALQDRA